LGRSDSLGTEDSGRTSDESSRSGSETLQGRTTDSEEVRLLLYASHSLHDSELNVMPIKIKNRGSILEPSGFVFSLSVKTVLSPYLLAVERKNDKQYSANDNITFQLRLGDKKRG